MLNLKYTKLFTNSSNVLRLVILSVYLLKTTYILVLKIL